MCRMVACMVTRLVGGRGVVVGGLSVVAVTAIVLSGCGSSSSGSDEPPKNAAAADVDGAWTQYDGSGQISARLVTRAPRCPTVQATGTGDSGGTTGVEMFVRAEPLGSGSAAFDDLVCEATLPPGTESAVVGDRKLPLPVSNPKRLVVLGDTGCRLKKGRPPQACNDPVQWPFAQIAKLAAAEGPDLVVHMGDEHYREAPCPDGDTGCAGSPWGYNAVSNRADFFTPAAPLLAAAPWVFVRGDHEGCPRNGAAWFRYWDARGNRAECTDYTDPFKVKIGDRSLLIFDSSNAEEKFPIKDQAQQETYKAQLEQIAALATGPSWFATHKPLWGIKPGKTAETFERTNPALQTATGNKLPKTVDLSMAGDLHLFEAFTFAKQTVPQIVIGNGGDLLADGPPPVLPGLALPEGVDTIRAGRIIQNYGYSVWDLSEDGTWQITLKDQNGAVTLKCSVGNGTTTCA